MHYLYCQKQSENSNTWRQASKSFGSEKVFFKYYKSLLRGLFSVLECLNNQSNDTLGCNGSGAALEFPQRSSYKYVLICRSDHRRPLLRTGAMHPLLKIDRCKCTSCAISAAAPVSNLKFISFSKVFLSEIVTERLDYTSYISKPCMKLKFQVRKITLFWTKLVINLIQGQGCPGDCLSGQPQC